MKTTLFGILITLVTLPALAASTTPEIPENLHIFSTGGDAFVDLSAKDCSGFRYRLDNDHPRYNTIVAILLAAQISKRQVVVRFTDCNNDGQGNISGVYLKG